MAESVPVADGAVPAGRSNSRRLPLLVGIGVLVVALAAGFRFSSWGREFQLQRASLDQLRLQAKEQTRDPLLLYYLGSKAYNAHSLGEAGYCFEEAVKIDPKMARAWLGLAVVERDIGQFPQAFSAAKEAQALRPKDADTQYLVATLVMQASKARATEEFAKLTRLAPKRAEGWYQLGVCHYDINQKGEALPAFRRAVALEPGNAAYQRDLGKTLLDTSFLAEARTVLERARKLDPSSAETCYLLGETRLRTAQSDADLRDADQLFAASEKLLPPPAPDNVSPRATLASERAEVARRLHQPKQALEFLISARKIDPTNLQLLYKQAEVLRTLGREAEAKPLLAEFEQRSAVTNAINRMTERVKQDPKSTKLRLEMARLYAKGGDFPRAANQYAYCLYLDPNQAEVKREYDAFKRSHPGVENAAPAAQSPISDPAPK